MKNKFQIILLATIFASVLTFNFNVNIVDSSKNISLKSLIATASASGESDGYNDGYSDGYNDRYNSEV